MVDHSENLLEARKYLRFKACQTLDQSGDWAAIRALNMAANLIDDELLRRGNAEIKRILDAEHAGENCPSDVTA